MKVLIVTGIFPPDHGGPASYVPAIAQAFSARNVEVTAIVTLSDRLEHDDREFGARIVRIPRGRVRPLRWLTAIGKVFHLSGSADVVYLNGLVLEGIIATRLFRNKPAVVKVVGDLIWERARNQSATSLELDDFQTATLPWRWAILRRLQGWYTNKASAVITPSAYMKRVVSRWGVDPERIHVVYNAVRRGRTTGRTDARFDVVTVARLVPWKGLPSLIAVCAANNWSLRIVGDGPLRESLAADVQRLNANVSFSGFVSHEDVADEIRSATVFVLNSTYEGLPHVVLEAKAAGVPVIATRVGGTPETIENEVDGLLVSPHDAIGLATAIASLLRSPERRAEFVAAGNRQLEQGFSFDTMVDETRSVLTGVTE